MVGMLYILTFSLLISFLDSHSDVRAHVLHSLTSACYSLIGHNLQFSLFSLFNWAFDDCYARENPPKNP